MATKRVKTHLDFESVGQLVNALLHVKTTEPTTHASGQLWYDSTTKIPKYYHDSEWRTFCDLTSSQTIQNHTLGSGTKVTIGSDAQGDIWYRATDGTLTRIGVGTNGQVLQSNGTIPGWADLAAGHTQNTDTGTTSTCFQIGSDDSPTGPKLCNSSGALHIRNSGDTDFAALKAYSLLLKNGVSTAVDTISSDTTLSADSDTVISTQHAVKTYVDNKLGTVNAMIYKGVIDCSLDPNYPAADAGHVYIVSVAGNIGGGAGPDVEVGDMLICMVDSTASGDHATVGPNWDRIQMNLTNYVLGPASTSENVVPKWDTATRLLKSSGVSIDGSNNISGGTWTGTAIAAIYGGTGQTAYTVGQILYASSTTALSKRNFVGSGTGYRVLGNQGDGGTTPDWAALSSAWISDWPAAIMANFQIGKSGDLVDVTDGDDVQFSASGALSIGDVTKVTTVITIPISHTDTDGYCHLPTGGSTGQILYWSAVGSGVKGTWGTPPAGSGVVHYSGTISASSGGTITAATHGCGTKPIVQVYQTDTGVNYLLESDVQTNSSGDVTWATNSAITGFIIIMGSASV
jgi:hypothetical protein